MQVGCHHDPIYSKISAEEQLIDDLLIGYNPLILPTPNNSLSVNGIVNGNESFNHFPNIQTETP